MYYIMGQTREGIKCINKLLGMYLKVCFVSALWLSTVGVGYSYVQVFFLNHNNC